MIINDILINSFSIVIPSILINTFLNIFGEIKRKYNFEKYDIHFDFDKKFKSGKPIIGTSTTWGGLILSLLLGWIIEYFFPNSFYAILLSLCVFFGHALGSFIKRRLDIPRGEYLPIVDHGDYIILVTSVFYILGYINILTMLVSIGIILIIHPLFCIIGYYLGLRENII